MRHVLGVVACCSRLPDASQGYSVARYCSCYRVSAALACCQVSRVLLPQLICQFPQEDVADLDEDLFIPTESGLLLDVAVSVFIKICMPPQSSGSESVSVFIKICMPPWSSGSESVAEVLLQRPASTRRLMWPVCS